MKILSLIAAAALVCGTHVASAAPMLSPNLGLANPDNAVSTVAMKKKKKMSKKMMKQDTNDGSAGTMGGQNGSSGGASMGGVPAAPK